MSILEHHHHGLCRPASAASQDLEHPLSAQLPRASANTGRRPSLRSEARSTLQFTSDRIGRAVRVLAASGNGAGGFGVNLSGISGYVASTLLLFTFVADDMHPLRTIAISSNLALIS